MRSRRVAQANLSVRLSWRSSRPDRTRDDQVMVWGSNGPSPAAQSRSAGPCCAEVMSTRSGPAPLSPALPTQSQPGDPPPGEVAACRRPRRRVSISRAPPGCGGPGSRRRSRPKVTKSPADNASCPPVLVAATLRTLYNSSAQAPTGEQLLIRFMLNATQRSASPGSGLAPSPSRRRSRTRTAFLSATYPPFGGRQFKGERVWSQ